MPRRRFSEREVIEALIRTGHEIRCYRTGTVIDLESVKRLEREHPVPLALGGADDPTNAAYSLKEAHAIQTNGTRATSAGSDKHAIAKVRRVGDKMVPHKMPLDTILAANQGRCRCCGQDPCQCQTVVHRSAFGGRR